MGNRLLALVPAWTRALAASLLVAAACGSPSSPGGTLTLRGRVVDSVSSAPIAGASVSLSGASIAGRSTSTDQSGGYTFQGLTPGNFTLNVTAPSYAASQTPVTLSLSRELDVSLVGLQRS